MILFLFIEKNIAINQCYRNILVTFCLVLYQLKKPSCLLGAKWL